MKYIYIAAPYTIGDSVINIRKAIVSAEELIEAGFVPFVPHLSHLWHLCSPHGYEYWMRLDKEWILSCDGLLRLDGDSHGADIEVAYALDNGIKVFYSLQEVKTFALERSLEQ